MAEKPETKKEQEKRKTAVGEKAASEDGSVRYLKGKKKVLVIAPHGAKKDDNFTNIIADELNRAFEFYAVVNDCYKKPGGEKADEKAKRLDLNKIEHAEKIPDDMYLGCIDEFANWIIEEFGEAIIIHVHGIKNTNIMEAGGKVPKDKLSYDPAELCVLLGFGQHRYNEQQRYTAKESTVELLSQRLAQNGMPAAEAPVEPIQEEEGGENIWYCGSDTTRMNQYFYDSGLPVQSIQLEIREKGFRTSEAEAKETAQKLGCALDALVESESKSDLAIFRTTLSENPEVRLVKIKEIDLSDRTFEARASEYGVDEKALDMLVADIRQKGILQNIILRRHPEKEKYQLISGFRRLAALERVAGEVGFPEREVHAKVFESLTDEMAHEVSLSENIARKNLSLWELANACRVTRDDLLKKGRKRGQVEAYLAELLKVNARTVRRYLAASTIRTDQIRRDLHNGEIDISIAAILARDAFEDEDREALHNFYKRHPMPFRSFDIVAKNILKVGEWSKLSIPEIVRIPTANGLLTMDPAELETKAQYLSNTRNKAIPSVLAEEINDLKMPVNRLKSKDFVVPLREKLAETSSQIQRKVSGYFERKGLQGGISIKLDMGSASDLVKLQLTVPPKNLISTLSYLSKNLERDFSAIEELYRNPPKPKRVERKGKKTDLPPNTDIAFLASLKELREAANILKKGGGITREDGNYGVLIRSTDEGKVQLRRAHFVDLLIDIEAVILKAGFSAVRLSDLLALKGPADGECEIIGMTERAEGQEDRWVLRIRIDRPTFDVSIQSLDPKPLKTLFEKQPSPAENIEVDGRLLARALGKVLPCINPYVERTSLTGAYFRIEKNQLTITGTNGVIFSEVTVPHAGWTGKLQEKIVSFGTATLVKEVMAKSRVPVKVGFTDERAVFRTEGKAVNGRLVKDAAYPDYVSIFRDSAECSSLVLPISDLRDALDLVAAFADPEDNFRTTLKTNKNRLELTSSGQTSQIPLSDKSGEIDLNVNAKFLAGLAKGLEGDATEIRHEHGTKYITIHPESGSQRALLTIIRRR